MKILIDNETTIKNNFDLLNKNGTNFHPKPLLNKKAFKMK